MSSRWPDVQALAVSWLRVSLGLALGEVATRVPGDVEQRPQFVRVARGPGSDDGVTDAPLLDVECFAPSEGAAWSLAEDARQVMHELTGRVVNGALVDSVSTSTAPVRVEYAPHVVRYVASYRLNLRKQF